MEGGNISNLSAPVLAFSYNCFLNRGWDDRHDKLLKKLPNWLFNAFKLPIVKLHLKLSPRSEASPIIRDMQDKAGFKVVCIDIVPGAVAPLVRSAMRRYFPTVELNLITDPMWRGDEHHPGISELRARLYEAALDTYYTTDQVVHSRLHLTPGLKVLYFTEWSSI